MLAFFRQKGVTSVVYTGVVLALVLVFFVNFNPSAGKKLGTLAEACAARVYGTCLDPKTHRAAYRLIFSRGTGSMSQSTASHIVLEGLIERELLVNEANRLGLTVSEDEVTDSIFRGLIHVTFPATNPMYGQQLGLADGTLRVSFNDPKTKQFDMKVYERTVKMMTGRSPGEFREWQSREILAAKMRDLVRAPVRVADDEGLDRYVQEQTTSTLEYAVVRYHWAGKYGIKNEAKEVAAWAKDPAHLKNVHTSVRHILSQFPKDATAEQKEETRKTSLAVLERVRRGEDFAALAKELSADPGSKDKGGQYTYEDVKGFVEPFRHAVERVAPGGLVTEPVETDYGYHVIKRDEASKEELLRAYVESKALELATRIRNDAKSGMGFEQSVTSASQAFAVVRSHKEADSADAGAGEVVMFDADPERPQPLTSSAFNRQGDPIPAISSETTDAVRRFAFSNPPGTVISEPIMTDEGWIVARVKEHRAATREDFDRERETFLAGLIAAKRAEALGQYVRRLRESAKADVRIDESNVLGAKLDGGAPNSDEDEP